jgi:hypothetical protein
MERIEKTAMEENKKYWNPIMETLPRRMAIEEDDTFLSLGPGSDLVIDQFVYAPRQGKLSLVFRMLKGTAVYLSGLIAKLAPDSVYFVTPSASVGVRGTKFAVKVEER